MHTRSLFLILIGFCFCLGKLHGQNETGNKYKIDSLNRQLAKARLDTERVRLRYLIGQRSKITRISYWDSLLKDAVNDHQLIYQCRSLSELAFIYRGRNDLPKAKQLMDEALELAEKNHLKREQLTIIKLYRRVYMDIEDEKRRKQVYIGLKLAEELGDKKLAADCYSEIAAHYFFLCDYPKALKMHFECLKRYRELNDRLFEAGTLADIGGDYQAMKKDDEAVKYYLESGEHVHEFGETPYSAFIYNTMGSAYLISNQPDSAYKYCSTAYNIYKKLGDRMGMASTLVVLSGAELKSNRLGRAEELILECIRIAKETGFRSQLPNALEVLKDVYIKKGDYKAALKTFEDLIAIRDTLSSEDLRRQALQKELDYKVDKKEKENQLLSQQNQIQSLELSKTQYILIGLGCLLLIVLVISYLIFKQNKLRAEQQSLQLEQKLLQSQINPHFIFNSLNSIQYFILGRQNDLAETYLLKFSRLIRELLESSTKETITVKQEADILYSYMEIEALRFRNAFSFSLTVDSAISEETDLIPSMMLQPFVENAIWHGLMPKQNNRLLEVNFTLAPNESIICIVEDNGVGREASRKREQTIKKKSLALGLINQRVHLIRKMMKLECSVEIIDKKDADGSVLGTKVIIILPLLNKYVKSASN